MIANILHTKGISEKHEILHILKQIKNLETLQQQINIATGVKSNLVYETTQLQDKENNLEINIKKFYSQESIFISKSKKNEIRCLRKGKKTWTTQQINPGFL